ncbi:glycosyl transferase [Acidianus sp. HS-5]|nr:glycosyl transferase [Acidianus sp. HS-5]
MLGGSERVAVAVLNTLKSLGFKVKLVTLNIDIEKVKKWDNNFVVPDEIIVKHFPVKFGLYKALYTSMLTKPGNTFSTIGDITNAGYSYIHFPWSLTDNLKKIHAEDDEPYIKNMRAYFLPYKYIHGLFFSRSKTKLLANSSWTGKILEISGYSYDVLYPPVETSEYLKIKGERNPKLVLSISRIAPEKNLNNLFSVAKILKDYTFILLGSSGRSKKYLEEVKSTADNLGNVKIIEDFTRDELLKYLGTAKIYFHPKVNEHFGISVVEAMSAGLIPVVHKSGGAWLDIVKEGKYGLGYSNVDEAVNSIIEASKYENNFRDVTLNFSFDKFKERLIKILTR